MNIKHLNYFIEVVKHKSFTKASKKLFLSQSTLSKAVKSIEEYLDIWLIDRASKVFSLTHAGRLFYENTVNALQVIEEELNKLKDNTSFAQGKIRLAIPPVLGPTHFASSIAEYQNIYPDIQLDIMEYGADMIQEKVLQGDADIGVTLLPTKSNDFHITDFFESNLVCVVNKEHKLANQSDISILDLKDEKLIILDGSSLSNEKIKNAFYKYNLIPNIVRSSSQWDLIIEMVSLNYGIAFLPYTIVNKYQYDNIRTFFIPEPELHLKHAFIVRKNKYISLAINAFIDFFLHNIR